MPNSPDGRYDNTKPWDKPAPGGIIVAPTSAEQSWSYKGPFSSNEERLTQQALVSNTLPREVLQQQVRPNLPQIQQFPSRFGLGDSRQPGIDDIVTLDRAYQNQRSTWFSGGGGDFSGSSRNSMEGV